MDTTSKYSVQQEAETLLQEGILKNPLMKHLPPRLLSLSQHVTFVGSKRPNIPINWRLAESIAALKGFEAVMLNLLLDRKCGTGPIETVIDTDHASLFFMSLLIASYMKNGERIHIDPTSIDNMGLFPNRNLHPPYATLYRSLATNIYKTKDGRFYHVHGSMNPDPSLSALGLPLEGQPQDNYDSVVDQIQSAVQQLDSETLDKLMNDDYRQAGTIAYTADEYLCSDHGRESSQVGLYEISKAENSSQIASWWPEPTSTSASNPKRPLAGLKVVDLSRVIAAPAISRSLAEMGASVMRVTSSMVTDLSGLHHDLNWGKWNCNLHLKDEEDKEKLRQLIKDADVVLDGYRPGVMDRLGFGRSNIFDLVSGRSRGIIHVRENCYGWRGPWSHRSGWQQISDACCGVSRSYSKAMGQDEAVTPVFPNSDYCTGVIGSTAILEALIRRAEAGGSYGVDVALNYYSQWLVQSCGTYSETIWDDLWARYDRPVFRHYHSMHHMIPEMMRLLRVKAGETLFHPSFFEVRNSVNLGTSFVVVKPIQQFPNGEVELGYHVGTRGNGVDEARWPKDLGVEIVTQSN